MGSILPFCGPSPIATDRDATTVIISPEPFGWGFDVHVRPVPMGVGHDREFRERGDALIYALRLQKAMGWRVRDLSEADGG